MTLTHRIALGAAVLLASASLAHAHGDVAPQPINTDALPDVGEDWLSENPYRADEVGEEAWAMAIKIGGSGYNQNCARCHGLEAISGGLAPDLRFLEAEEYGDEWFVERFQVGYTQNGVTKMPAFGELLGQKAAWAIRTYIETRPDDAAMADASDELKAIRDELKAAMDAGGDADLSTHIAKLNEVASGIDTLSGAPVADSIALRAAHALEADEPNLHDAVEILNVGLSVAH